MPFLNQIIQYVTFLQYETGESLKLESEKMFKLQQNIISQNKLILPENNLIKIIRLYT